MLTNIPISENIETERIDRLAFRYQEELQSADPGKACNKWISIEEVETLPESTEFVMLVNLLDGEHDEASQPLSRLGQYNRCAPLTGAPLPNLPTCCIFAK